LERNRIASKIILSRGFRWLHVRDLLDSLEQILTQNEHFDVCLADLDFTHKVYTSGVDVMKWSHLIRTGDYCLLNINLILLHVLYLFRYMY
jgi:hypothetical protein